VKIDSKIQVAALCALITGICVLSRTNKKINWKRAISDQHDELVHSCKTNAGVVQAQMMPAALFYRANIKTGSVYVLLIKLKAKQPIQSGELRQYMNFGIGRFFFAMCGGDTLQQIACEKMLGIDRNEFIYLTCFEKTASRPGGSLFIYIADTIAGFGFNRFEFKGNALRKLE
jgi:hypothetical protein